MNPRIVCLYCNATMDLVDPPADAQKIFCSRCGEQFPLRNRSQSSAASPLASEAISSALQKQTSSRQAKALRSVRRTLMIGIFLGMLGIALGLLIAMIQKKELPSDSSEPAPIVADWTVIAPRDLVNLGYLPEKTQGVIALQVRPIFSFYKQVSTVDPKQQLIDAGLPESLLSQVEKSMGRSIRSLDQLIIGFRFQPVGIFVIAQFQEPMTPETLFGKRKHRVLSQQNRILYEPTEGLKALPLIWSPLNASTWMGALTPEDFRGVPKSPVKDLAQLSPELKTLLTEKITPDSVFWGVITGDDWRETIQSLSSLMPKKNGFAKQVDQLSFLRSALLSFRLEQKPIGSLWLELSSETQAEKLRKDLIEQFASEEGKIQIGGPGRWCFIRMEWDQTRLAAIAEKWSEAKKLEDKK